jgi:hypothetical protein
MRRTSGIAWWRWVIALGALGGWSALMLAVGRRAAGPLAALAGALFTVPLASLGEWLVHGIFYHRSLPGLGLLRRIHHHGHHFALFPPRRYVKAEGHEFMRVRAPLTPFRMADNPWDNALTKWSQVSLHFVAGIPLILWPAWMGTARAVFAGAALVTLAGISWLLAHVHGAIHTPRGRWIEGRAWFRWLDRHHYIHHVDLSANINFMLPLCDFLLGTRKAALSEIEALTWPSYEQARALPGPERRHLSGPSAG